MATRFSQPQSGVGIDWSNPLCRALSHVSVGDSAVNLVGGEIGTLIGTVSKVVGPKGTALRTATGAANRIDFAHKLDAGGSAYSFGSVFTHVYPGTFQYLMMRELAGVLGGTYTILMAMQASSGSPRIQVSFGTAGLLEGNVVVSDSVWHTVSVSTPPNGDTVAANGAVWLDGVKNGTANSAAGGTVGASLQTNLYFNGRPSDNARQLNGAQALKVEWRRPLTDAEHASFNANPWQIFEHPARSLWMFVAGGGAGIVNLAANATGQTSSTANLLKGVSLAGAALGVATATAGMAHTVPMAATATATASSTGQIALTVTFAADAVASAVATALMSLGKPLSAAAAAQGTATAALDVTAGGSAVNLAAAATSMDTATATLSLVVNLSAAAVAQATATATLGGSSAMAAAAIADAQASAAMAVGKPLAAAAVGQATGGANLWLDVQLGAQALATAAAGGALSLTITLAASALGQASAGAFLPSNISLAAGAVSMATGAATLMVTGPIVGNAAMVARDLRRSWTGAQRARGWTSAERRRRWTARST